MPFDVIYADELNRLRTLGLEFSKKNPALAPFLGSTSGDPDVERLLQGFAFLSAMVRQKMDDEIPEFIHDVASLVSPELAQPLPPISVLQMSVSGKCEQGLLVAKQTPFASTEVEGTVCQFSTSWPIRVQPVSLQSIAIEPLSSGGTELKLSFSLNALTLGQWGGEKLSLFLSGSFSDSCAWVLALRQKIIGATVASPDGEGGSRELRVSFPGLEPANSLFEAGKGVADHLRWMRDFLAFPERAFFLDLEGFSAWNKPPIGQTFVVRIQFSVPPESLPKASATKLAVNAVPAANLFQSFAEPIEINHLRESYRIRPMDSHVNQSEVNSVLHVAGRRRGEAEDREYVPFTDFLTDSNKGKYQVIFSEGRSHGQLEFSIRLPFDGLPDLNQIETLSIKLRCTNGKLAEKLRIGDICQRTVESPERISVTNITVPTSYAKPSLGEDSMWRIVGHSRLNLVALAEVDAVKEMLFLYTPQGGDPTRLTATKRRIEGVESLSLEPMTKMHRGTLIRGYRLIMRLNRNFYAGTGDLMVFGEMLVHFFAGVVPLNAFLETTVIDSISGEQFEWQPLLAPGLNL